MRNGGTSLTELCQGLVSGPAAASCEARDGPVPALRRKIDELERFAFVAAHDLQEPLRMVAGYTQILSERYGDQLDPAATEFLAFALEGARRMQDLVDGLLLLARADPEEDRRSRTSSAEAVSAAVANLRLAIQESGATLLIGSLPEVLADPLQLVRLFQNLIGNAIRHHAAGLPVISVAGEERGRDWLFRVADNGKGLAVPVHFGLGLEICRRIAEQHGGRLWMSAQGGGAVVCFTLAMS